MIDDLSIGFIGSIIFLLIVFISYVTAADSNTTAMSGLSTRGVDAEDSDAPVLIKVIWGVIISVISWVMISYAGLDGIRIQSVIGGFPILFFCMYVVFIFARIIYHKQL